MAKSLEVLAVSGKAADCHHQDRIYLTLTEPGGKSDNRYYVSLTGKEAALNWQKGDCILVDLGMCAYRNMGQWYVCCHPDAMELVEISVAASLKLNVNE